MALYAGHAGNYKVDPDRLAVIGISIGGKAAWEFAHAWGNAGQIRALVLASPVASGLPCTAESLPRHWLGQHAITAAQFNFSDCRVGLFPG